MMKLSSFDDDQSLHTNELSYFNSLATKNKSDFNVYPLRQIAQRLWWKIKYMTNKIINDFLLNIHTFRISPDGGSGKGTCHIESYLIFILKFNKKLTHSPLECYDYLRYKTNTKLYSLEITHELAVFFSLSNNFPSLVVYSQQSYCY